MKSLDMNKNNYHATIIVYFLLTVTVYLKNQLLIIFLISSLRQLNHWEMNFVYSSKYFTTC